MYIHRLNLIITVLVALLATSCQKKEFTEPVKVNLEVAIAYGESSYLSFKEGHILFEQILFDGQRHQGGSVHFATESGNEIGPVQFADGSSGAIKKFDIPQGIYNSMQWRFILDEIEMFIEKDEEEDDDDDEDDKEYDNDYDSIEDGGLILTGTFYSSDGDQKPLYIVLDDDEQLIVSSQNVGSYGDIILTSENTYTAQLLIDPFYAMQTISEETIENAEVSTNESGEFIEISEENNEALYEIIVYRLESSLKVFIE
ncbi:MAG: hypothetical protein MI866_00355 [Bacteroidales bacterium]|nr:hypothetical protein [Bacteroidales bacterium]